MTRRMATHRTDAPAWATAIAEKAEISGSKNKDARIAKVPMTTWPAKRLQNRRTARVTRRRMVDKTSMSQTRAFKGKATPAGARLFM